LINGFVFQSISYVI